VIEGGHAGQGIAHRRTPKNVSVDKIEPLDSCPRISQPQLSFFCTINNKEQAAVFFLKKVATPPLMTMLPLWSSRSLLFLPLLSPHPPQQNKSLTCIHPCLFFAHYWANISVQLLPTDSWPQPHREREQNNNSGCVTLTSGAGADGSSPK